MEKDKDMHIPGDIKQRKAEVALLSSDKVDFRVERINGVINEKRANLPRRHSNPKCPCTKQQSYKISEQKTKNERRKWETTAVLGDFTISLSTTMEN